MPENEKNPVGAVDGQTTPGKVIITDDRIIRGLVKTIEKLDSLEAGLKILNESVERIDKHLRYMDAVYESQKRISDWLDMFAERMIKMIEESRHRIDFIYHKASFDEENDG